MNNHTDKELLMLAAKAAGLNVKMFEVDSDDNFSGLIVGAKNTREKIWWNPLFSDGDALRLAVKLWLYIFIDDNKVHVDSPDLTVLERFKDCQYAATRRAIVRAAAAIGSKL